MIGLVKRGFRLLCISLVDGFIKGTRKINYGTHWKTVTGQSIFKAIFGHFLNKFGTEMKIRTSNNILNNSIAQMNFIK